MRMERDAALMSIAGVMSKRSSCSRMQVGAVIARDGRILSSGYNGTPAGMPHCDHTCICRPPLEFPLITGKHREGCPEVSPCASAVHAEANAIVFAARFGGGTEGARMYTTHVPCQVCATLIICAGIVAVYYAHPYRVNDGLELLDRAHIEIVNIP